MTKRELFDLADLAGDAAVIVRSSGTIVYWSDEAERLFGFSRSVARGRRCFDLLKGRTCDGKPFCSEHCVVLAGLDRRARHPAVDLEVATADKRSKWVSLTTMLASLRTEERPVAMHLCRELSGDLQIAAVAKRACARVSELLAIVAESTPDEKAVLSERERQVLLLAAEGLTARGTAAKLGIAPSTVRNHIRNVLEKLGRHTKIGAVTEARRRGLL